MRFVKPLDEKLILDLAAQHKLLVTIEENVIAGGAGSAVSEFLATHQIETPVLNLGLPDIFIDHGDREVLLQQCGLDSAGIQQTISDYYQQDCKTERTQLIS
jgi:1-deoxy-D-xylulose-5-phosphate synthase